MKSFSSRLCTWTLLVVASLAVACRTAEVDGGESVAPGPIGSPCQTPVETADSEKLACINRAGSHDVAVLGPRTGDVTRIVLVDLGGPVVDISEVVDVLELVASQPEPRRDDSIFVGLAPAEVDIPEACEGSKPMSIPADCSLYDLGTAHYDGYRESLEHVISWFGDSAEYHLLGASFAAARWEELLLHPDVPPVSRAVFVSPFAGGLTPNQVGDGLTDAARVLFQQVLDGCQRSDCLLTIEPLEPANCRAFDCRPEQVMSSVSGRSPDAVLLGMYGLLPTLDLNADLIAAAVAHNDRETMLGYLDQGEAAFRGVDVFGSYTPAQLHHLGAICSAFIDNSAAEASPFPACAEVATRPALDVDVEFRDENYRAVICFYAPQPDPLLGYAASSGHRFGTDMLSATEPLEAFVHGDLALGARRLGELVATGRCPIPDA